jgi:hypothetical protein
MITALDTSKLLEPQIPHAIKLLDSIFLNGIACDLSETGIGKTYVASWIAKQVNSHTVIVCPKNAMPVWGDVLKSFGVTSYIIVNYEKLVRGGTPWLQYKKPSNKVNPKTGQPIEMFKYQLIDVKFPAGSLVIMDEAHKCKGVNSLNAGLMIDLKRKGYNVLTLSATQATNPVEMRAFGFATNLHDLYGWKKWCIDSGAKEHAKTDTLSFDREDPDTVSKMQNCHESLFNIQRISSRLTRDQMGVLFPENHVIAEAYDLGPNNESIQYVYEEMEYQISQLEEGTADYSSHVFAEIIKARRKAELLKIPLFAEMFEDLYDEGKSILIFLNFTESINCLHERLKDYHNKIGLYYGEVSFKERKENVRKFQADEYRGIIANLKCGGASLSFHDLRGKYPRASLMSPSFSAVDMVQALGRIHRAGGLSKCFQRIIYAAVGIEQRCCVKVQARLNNLSDLVDGDLTDGFRIFNQ